MTDEEIRNEARKAFDAYASPPLELFSKVMHERVEAVYRAGMHAGQLINKSNTCVSAVLYCANWLYSNGLAAPKTCEKCGLGPCKDRS